MLRSLDQLMERKEDGGMKFIWVPLVDDVRTLIMDKAHASRSLVHSGANKMYYNLRDMYGGHVWRRILLPMLPKSSSGCDTNWVTVDRLTKALVNITEGIENTTKTCVRLIILKRTDKLSFGCVEGSVGHMFFGLKLEKFGRLDQNWYKRQQISNVESVVLEDVVHFGKKEVLAPRDVRPFEIIKGIGPIAY
ncbi:hypothetical protein Tco_0775266 [Tanacetum coccineum]